VAQQQLRAAGNLQTMQLGQLTPAHSCMSAVAACLHRRLICVCCPVRRVTGRSLGAQAYCKSLLLLLLLLLL
jgi:hypothetical protein